MERPNRAEVEARLAERIRRWARGEEGADQILQEASDAELELIERHWGFEARADQWLPKGDWLTWLILGDAGPEDSRRGGVRARPRARLWPFGPDATGPIALVGETYADVREVMIEGVAGLLRSTRASTARCGSPRGGGWNGRRVSWPMPSPPRIRRRCAGRNSRPPGATSSGSGGTRRRPGTCSSSGCGSGARPRQMVTTTPRPIPLLRRLIKDPSTVVTRATHGDECAEPGGRIPRRASSRATTARGSGGRSSTAS